MKYKIGETYTFPDGRTGIVEDARENIAGEEYDINVKGQIILVAIEEGIS